MSVKNIVEGLKLKGRPAKIIDCGRDDLPGFFKEMGYKVGAEIGVYKGEFTKKFLDAGLKMYGIDPWRAYKNYDEHHELRFKHQGTGRFQERQDFLYEHTQRYLKEYLESGQCKLVRKTSMDAVEDFKDGSLDFIYIDGHHGFRYVAEDLCEWSMKVRNGGIVAGHDYALNDKPPRDPYVLQVKYVLHAYTEAFHIKNWYVLGRTETIEGEIRDKWRSWMFIRNEK